MHWADFCKFSLATPYPGTELWNIAREEGALPEDMDWSSFSQMAGFTKKPLLYAPRGRSSLGLKLLQRMANAVYYMKPSVFFGMYRRFRDMGQGGKFFSTVLTGMKAVLLPGGGGRRSP